MVGHVSGSPPPDPSTPDPGLPDPTEGNPKSMYSAKNAPGIAHWFRQVYPNMSEKELDKAVSGWMKNEVQFFQTLMKKLEKERKKAMQNMKDSVQGR